MEEEGERGRREGEGKGGSEREMGGNEREGGQCYILHRTCANDRRMVKIVTLTIYRAALAIIS